LDLFGREVYPALVAGSPRGGATYKEFHESEALFFICLWARSLPAEGGFIPHLMREAQEEEQRIKSFTKVKLFISLNHLQNEFIPKLLWA